MMKIGTYTVYLNTIDDVYQTLELAKEKYDPENRFQVNIIADDEREINMYTAELISSNVEIQEIETVGIRVSEIPLQESLPSQESSTEPDDTQSETDSSSEEDGSSSEAQDTQSETDSSSEEKDPSAEPEADGLKQMSFGEKVEISEAYVSKSLITSAEEAASQITKDSQKNEIYEVLEKNNIGFATHKQSINLVNIENLLMREFENISLISTTIVGNTLFINIKESVDIKDRGA